MGPFSLPATKNLRWRTTQTQRLRRGERVRTLLRLRPQELAPAVGPRLAPTTCNCSSLLRDCDLYMRLEQTKYDNSETGCCAKLDTKLWDGRELDWNDKLFLK